MLMEITNYEDYDDIGVVSLRWVKSVSNLVSTVASPEEILTLMNMMGGRGDVMGTRQEETIFTTCPAATVCVALSR